MESGFKHHSIPLVCCGAVLFGESLRGVGSRNPPTSSHANREIEERGRKWGAGGGEVLRAAGGRGGVKSGMRRGGVEGGGGRGRC